MENLQVLTEEKFLEIYTNEKLRNAVAYAHICNDSKGNFLHRKALMFPISYKVTNEQVEAANIELNKAKEKAKVENIGKLVFIGMGMEYPERYPNDVCNHRVRGEFINKYGKKYFIEFGTGRITGEMRIDHSIDRDLEEQNKDKSKQQYNNCKDLERRKFYPKYTKTDILELINKEFDCNFKEVVIDNYTLSPNEIISVSPSN
jgi:hypothetical protein